MPRRRLTALPVVPLAAALALAACSGGSSKGSASLSLGFKDAAEATRSAGPAKTNGTVKGPGGGQGPVQGSVDGDLSGTGTAKATLFAASTRADVEIRWVDKTIYVNRAAVADPKARAAAGIEAWMLRAPKQLPWTQRSVESQFTPDLFAPFAPAALADLMVTRAVPVDVTRDGSLRKLHGTKPLPILGAWTKATVDLWVDDSTRVVRVGISSAKGGMTYDVKYGGSAPKVVAPPANQIDHGISSTPTPTGPFVAVASGSDNGVSWRLLRAPATRGSECWRWEATPAVKVVGLDAAGNHCVALLDPTDDPPMQAQFVGSTDGKGKYDFLAIRLPANSRSVAVSPVGGQGNSEPVSGATYVWVGPIAGKAGFAAITLADGTRLACGPGSITLPSDWSSVAPEDKDRLMASPWVCT